MLYLYGMKLAFIHNRMAKIFMLCCVVLSGNLFSQTSFNLENFKPDPAEESMFLPYLAVRHGGMQEVENWKKQNTVKYYQELWYYTESFYIKRNHLSEGYVLDESIIDISRFESQRKAEEEAIVSLPGFKDVIVLLPAKTLKYKPEYIQ